MLALFSGISPLISSRKRAPFPSSFAKPFYRKHRPRLSCDTVFPVSRCRARSLLPPTKKIPRLRSGWRYEKNAFPTHSFFAWCTRYPFPTLSFRAQSRNPPCTLFFLAPFAEGFQFYFVTHTTLYRCARKIPRLRSGWRCGNGVFQTYPLYATWNKPILPYRHFERSEKSSLHSALSCSFRKTFPLFRYHTYGIIPSCKKDSSASLGMTIQE